MDHLIGNSWLWSAVSDALPPIEEEKPQEPIPEMHALSPNVSLSFNHKFYNLAQMENPMEEGQKEEDTSRPKFMLGDDETLDDYMDDMVQAGYKVGGQDEETTVEMAVNNTQVGLCIEKLRKKIDVI
jgi:hypothetical protein